MRLLVCAAASMVLVGADALALDDTPTQPTYVQRHEVVRSPAPLKLIRREPVVAAPPHKKRDPAVVLAQEKFRPSPCRAMPCVPDLSLRGPVSGSP